MPKSQVATVKQVARRGHPVSDRVSRLEVTTHIECLLACVQSYVIEEADCSANNGSSKWEQGRNIGYGLILLKNILKTFYIRRDELSMDFLPELINNLPK